MQKHKTTKLFWDKYLYKLVLSNTIGSIFRDKNLPYAREVLDQLQSEYEEGLPLFVKKYKREQRVSENDFLDARKIYNFLSHANDYMLRIESYTFCIYSSNKHWLTIIKQSMSPNNVKEFWEPDLEDIELLNPKTIIMDKDIGFEYKVTLGQNIADTFGFANWAENNPNQVKVGPKLLEELKHNGYVSDLYFYARDEKTLQLCSLMLTNIRRIDKIIVKADLDK